MGLFQSRLEFLDDNISRGTKRNLQTSPLDNQPETKLPKQRNYNSANDSVDVNICNHLKDRSASSPTPATNQKEAEPAHGKGVSQSTQESQNEVTAKRHKYAMVIGYLGAKYQGMQRNPGAKSIEGEMEKALCAVGLIPSKLNGDLRKMDWSRAARTDKGVSAAGQVVSTYLYVSNIDRTFVIDQINAHLPEDIRVLGLYLVSGGFHAKNACDRRRYEYVLPTWTLCANKEEHERLVANPKYEDKIQEKIGEFNRLLQRYCGTHHFHNFTLGQSSSDGSCQRYILEFRCLPPFFIQSVSFLRVIVIGQSFLLHQIRKMIGLTIAIYKGIIPEMALTVALSKDHRLELQWHQVWFLLIRQRATKFKESVIYPYIAENEENNQVMERWLFLVRTKHPVDVNSISQKYEECIHRELFRENKRNKYLRDCIVPIVNPSHMYTTLEGNQNEMVEERTKACEECLFPKSVALYIRVPVIQFCMVGELTGNLGVPSMFVSGSEDIIFAVSIDEDDSNIAIYNCESSAIPCWKMTKDGNVTIVETFKDDFSSFQQGWLVAKSYFQPLEEVKGATIAMHRQGTLQNAEHIAFYCAAFVIFMKLYQTKTMLSRKEIAEVLTKGSHQRCLNFDSRHIFSCLCSSKDHFLVLRPEMDTQKVTLEYLPFPEHFLNNFRFYQRQPSIPQDVFHMFKIKWIDWLQKVGLGCILALKQLNGSWVQESKEGVVLRAHLPGMLRWKLRNPEEQRKFDAICGEEKIIIGEQILNDLNLSYSSLQSLIGNINMEESFNWQKYVKEFLKIANDIEKFLQDCSDMIERKKEAENQQVENEMMTKYCDLLKSQWQFISRWCENDNFSLFNEYHSILFLGSGLQSNLLLGSVGHSEDDDWCPLCPSKGICLWYPHFVRHVASDHKRKPRKSARKYRLR
eukprot:jgi/Galph1/3647/GphlegSOOS_G2254.1